MKRNVNCAVCATIERVQGDSRLDDGLIVGLLKDKKPSYVTGLYATACTRHRQGITYWKKKLEVPVGVTATGEMTFPKVSP